ncbi:MAG: hypothetical protein PHV34_15720 [Verrucomicrobiae bacterium]|nr:hypothetical protein [Verrucomicrobiae bacterium]
MSLERRGFVGFFPEKLTRERVGECVASWLERFGGVEQATGGSRQVMTMKVKELKDVVWEKDMQFRVLSGEQFAWVYLTLDRWVIETSGMASGGGAALCRDVLTLLPGCAEIIDERNDHRLDQLEAEGLM